MDSQKKTHRHSKFPIFKSELIISTSRLLIHLFNQYLLNTCRLRLSIGNIRVSSLDKFPASLELRCSLPPLVIQPRIWRSPFLPPQHLPQPINNKYYWFYILNINVFPPHLIFLILTSLVQVIFLLLQPFLTGLFVPIFAPLQSTLHWVARVMFPKYKPGQVTPQYKSIQWFPLSSR